MVHGGGTLNTTLCLETVTPVKTILLVCELDHLNQAVSEYIASIMPLLRAIKQTLRMGRTHMICRIINIFLKPKDTCFLSLVTSSGG